MKWMKGRADTEVPAAKGGLSKLEALKVSQAWEQPRIYDLGTPADQTALEALLKDGQVSAYFDRTDLALPELYDIEHPSEKDLPEADKLAWPSFKQEYTEKPGLLAYFPWNKQLVKIPHVTDLRKLRTSRNRNLIQADEQAKLYEATILIAGLSVGSNIVEALVSMGIGGTLILADMDRIEPSNLNRIRAPYSHVGVHKADAVAMRMSEIDPFLNFQLYRDGLDEKTLLEILDTHRPDIIIDEMDQLPLKVKIRQQARERHLPVISAADDGHDTLLDLELFNKEPDYPIFHGHIDDTVLNRLQTDTSIPRPVLGMSIGRYFIGPENIPLRMYESLDEVGKSLPSWPQLGGAAAISGIVAAYSSYKLLTNQAIKSGRYVIGPDSILGTEVTAEEAEKHAAYIARLESFNL